MACAYAATRLMQGADCTSAQLQPDQLSEIIHFDDDAATLLKKAIEHLSCLLGPIIKSSGSPAPLPTLTLTSQLA